MSDFLTRLAGRALGTAPVAQPLIPSIFTAAAEPGGISAINEFTEAQAGNARGEPGLEAVAEELQAQTGNARGEPGPDAVAEKPPFRMQSQSTLANTRGPSVRHDPAMDSHERRNVEAGHVEQLAPGSPAREQTSADPGVSADIRPVQKTRPVDSIPRREEVRITAGGLAHEISRTIPERRAVPLTRNSSDRAEHPVAPIATKSQAPIIRVTIGRVDVRAEFPAPATPAATRRAAAPSLSLDDYLKLRNEGKR